MVASRRRLVWGLVFLIIMTVSSAVSADNICPVEQNLPATPPTNDNGTDIKLSSAAYVGNLKVYIVEPSSRFLDDNGARYENGFLNWGLKTDIQIADGATWEQTEIWDATDFNDQFVHYTTAPITEGNIKAVAAVFRQDSVFSDAYPGNGFYYYAHYADAAAEATPGTSGKNVVMSGYTHTVFLEEATATW